MTTMFPKKFVVFVAIVVAILSLLFVCGCRARRSTHQTDTIVMAMGSSPTNLDPRIGIDKVSEDFHHLLFNGLLKRDEHDRMVPDLAESFEKVSPVLYRFRLRKGVRFHDGTLLDADDVVFTYTTILNGSPATTKKAALDSIASIASPDKYLVEIRLQQPFNGLLTNLSIGIVPENAPLDFARRPVGTGPYRLVELRQDEEATLEAFSQYFEGPSKTRLLRIRIIPDATTRVLELRKRGVDLIMGPAVIPPDYFRVLRKDTGLKILQSPGSNYAYLGFNLRDPILRDRRVRQAIGFAIDRTTILKTMFQGNATLAYGLLAPHHWAYDDDVLHISYDPIRSKHLLDQAGFPDPDGDGPRQRFLLTYKTSTIEFRRTLATIFQSDLEKVGISLKIRFYEWGTFFADINRGNFQMCMLMWIGETDPDIYRDVFSTGGSRNRGKYSDRQVDEWVQKAKTASTESEQRIYYSLIQRKIAEDCPYISLWFESSVAVMRKELNGIRLTPGADVRVLKEAYWKF